MLKKDSFKCEECGSWGRAKSCRTLRGKTYCYGCYSKRIEILPQYGYPRIPLDEALARTYKVNLFVGKSKKSLRCYVNFPSVLAGKKFKIKLVGEEEND